MAKQVIKNYAFDANAKTITFSDFTAVRLDRLVLVTDVTTNQLLYNFADNSGPTASVSGNVITLSRLPSGVSSGDKLRLDYDSLPGDPAYDGIASGSPDLGSPIKIGGKYNATPPTLSDGARADIQTDIHGNLLISPGVLMPGEDPDLNVVKIRATSTELNGSASALNGDVIPSADVSAYAGIMLQVIGTWVGTISFQVSNDNSNWSALALVPVGAITTAATTTILSNNVVAGSLGGARYFRARMTTYSSGTATATAELRTGSVSAQTMGVVLQNATGTIAAATPTQAMYVGTVDSSGNMRGLAASLGDNSGSTGVLDVVSKKFNGSGLDRPRTPAVFTSAFGNTAGDSVVWTPGAGKKFRLLRFKIMVLANTAMATAGSFDIRLRDATTDLNLTHSIYLPATAATTFAGHYDSGWTDLGEKGILSSTANNALNMNLSAAPSSGGVRIIVCGTEE